MGNDLPMKYHSESSDADVSKSGQLRGGKLEMPVRIGSVARPRSRTEVAEALHRWGSGEIEFLGVADEQAFARARLVGLMMQPGAAPMRQMTGLAGAVRSRIGDRDIALSWGSPIALFNPAWQSTRVTDHPYIISVAITGIPACAIHALGCQGIERIVLTAPRPKPGASVRVFRACAMSAKHLNLVAKRCGEGTGVTPNWCGTSTSPFHVGGNPYRRDRIHEVELGRRIVQFRRINHIR